MKKNLCFTLLFVAAAVSQVRADTTLVFNEIMYHPATNEPALEWVELHNQMAVDLDISDWRLSGDINFKFPVGTRAPGRGFVVVAANPSALMAATGLTNVFGPVTNRLANNGGTLEIRNNSDRVLDSISFGVDGEWPVTPDGSGVSLAKRDRDFGSAKASSWTQSAQIGGTPGSDNFPLVSSVRLIAINDPWKYEASGTDLGTAWRNANYNDSAWASRVGFTNRAITTLFNTGVGDDRVVIAPGGTDPHYVLTAGAQGTVGANVIAILNHPNWLANDPVSSFIGVVTPGATTINGGGYNFQTTFLLDGFIPGTAQVNLNVAVDNLLTNVFINGLPSGLNTAGFAVLNPPLTVTSGFVSGVNALEFRTVNEGAGPGGFRATLNGSALAARTDLAVGNSTYYFRKSFNFGADPKYSALMINPVVADGAVFYLNGVEVYRQNMPAGSVAYATAAATNVASPDLRGPITISASNLVQGANVLAVEVHQAAGGTDGPVFGTELAYAASVEPPLALAFNEISAATNASFWLELANYGTNAIPLGGYVITRDIQGTNVTANYTIPSGTTIQPGGFLVLSNSTLGFAPLSGDKLFLFAPNKANVIAGVIARSGPRARFPDGTGDWLIPSAPTPGALNSFAFRNEIVINEIMYHHKALPPVAANIPPKNNPEAWIELYNRSSNTVDLTGWELGGGVSYRFAAGKAIPANGYLIVADDAADLRAKYPSLDIVGNLGGRLSHSDDHIVLRDPIGNPADEVHYYGDGRWPGYPDGGGSSLELRDPNSDNSKAEAWASSDEGGKSSWQTYSYRMVANIPAGSGQPTQWQDFILGLQAAGECFIDDLSVVESPASSPAQIIANGNFESGLTGWRVLGTHGRSRVEPEPGNTGNNVLRVIATGAQEHMHNHIETTLLSGKTITAGREYEISFRARWLAGNHLLNTRLYFNRSARTVALSYPQSNGTPGARNSSFVANAGPTFSDFGHQPIVPAANNPVTVSAVAQDPQGVTSARVFWSVNSGAWSSAAMTASTSGRYTGTIPGQSAGAVVQFYVQATDSLGATATFPARGTNSGALYKVDDGQAILSLAHNVRIILTPANIDLLHGTSQGVNQTNVMSNDLLPCTVIYDERRAYYDCGTHLRGSQRGRYSDIRTGFHIEFQPDDLFRGVHPVMSVDRSGQGDTVGNRQEEIVIRHILNRAGGIPGAYTEIARLLAPRAAHTGPVQFFPRQEDVFVESAFENGGDGTLYEMELIYYPTTENAARYKNPQPDAVIGTDVTDLGDDKELYRYNFIIKNHRDADDYSRFVALGKAWALPAGSAALDAATRQLMDIDEWMRGYALVSLCAVGDMYGFGNNHNFLMYIRPSDGKFLYFPTDMDFAFSRAATDVLVGNQNLAKVVNLPGNLRRLYAHMLDIINTSFNANYMTYWCAHYASFAPGQNYSGTGTSGPGNSLGAITARAPFVLSTINGAGGNTPFNVAVTNISTGSNLVAITGTAPVQVKTIEINGNEYPITWTTISAWRISVPVSEASNALNVVARDYSGNVISNSSRTITVAYTNAPPPDPRGVIVFNEIMFNPLQPDAAYIELFNTSSNFTYDLSGWEINGLGFTFPPGSIITNRQYLVIAANAAAYVTAYGTGAGTPSAEFGGNLQNDGETLTLIKPAATTNGVAIVVDKIRYESTAPWPTVANGTGSSIQLIDAAQDNSRPLNWYSFHAPSIAYPAVTNVGWQFRSITNIGNPAGLRLLLYLDSTGELYVDDISVVEGTTAAIGVNLVRNGDFETPLLDDPPLTNSWFVPTNYTNSAISSQLVHSGNGSFHILANPGGAQSSRIMSQNLSPAPTNAQQIYTLSFWFFATNTASNLVVRVLNTGLNSQNVNTRPTVDPASNTVPVVALSPGASNPPATSLAPIPPLWINEVQPDNVSGILDNNGQRDPWIELYNSGTSAVSLDGLFLSGNYTNLTNWAFPAGRGIGAGQFMVIFCDAQPAQTTATQLHTGFRLTSGSGSVALSRLESGVPRVLDYVNYSGVRSNNSYGSIPDGQQFERREFAFATPGGTNDGRSAPLRVFINEWMAGNTNGITDPADGANDDWFELYNPGDAAVDLTGYFLTDNLADKFQYEIGTNGAHTIPARGYLLVWADAETGQNSSGGVARSDLHVNFRLTQTGEAIGLFAADGTQIDAITFTNQTDDVSQGRFPDGSTNIVLMPNSATPRAANRLDSTGPSVQFSTPTLNGNNFILSWSTTAGKTYRVEYKNDLGAAIWLPLGSNIVATGNMLSMTNSITNSPQRFFRIQVVQ